MLIKKHITILVKTLPDRLYGILLLFAVTSILLCATSCMDDDVLRDFDRLNSNKTNKGVFIINEGNFMYGNASLSYYSLDSNKVINNIFYETNALPLGDVAQSMTIKDSLGYIVINNSGKIYIININTFEYRAKITGLVSPRHIHFVNNEKAYITDLYSKKISIYNPVTNEITGTIDINNGNAEFSQHSSETMLQHNGFVYVNCWSFDNTILVINTQTDRVVDSIKVEKQPNSMAIDKNNNLWVLSDGGFAGSSYGQANAALTKIDLNTNTIINKYIFTDINASPKHLCINQTNDTLFYIYGSWGGTVANSGVYSMSVNSSMLPTKVLINTGGKIVYGLYYDNNSNHLFFSDAIDNTQNGIVYRSRTNGIITDTLKVGINPGAFCGR